MDLNQAIKIINEHPLLTPEEESIEAYSTFFKCLYGVDIKDSSDNYKSIYDIFLEASNNRQKEKINGRHV